MISIKEIYCSPQSLETSTSQSERFNRWCFLRVSTHLKEEAMISNNHQPVQVVFKAANAMMSSKVYIFFSMAIWNICVSCAVS